MRKIAFSCLSAGLLLLAAIGLMGANSGLAPISAPPGATCAITALTLSNNTFNSGSANAPVGTLSTTTTGTGCATPSYAVVSTGTDHSGTSCNASSATDFTVTSADVAANGSPGAGTYSNICFKTTLVGATGSPFTQAIPTITGAPITGLSVNLTVVETTGSTQTNVPFTIGVPAATGQLDGVKLVAKISGSPLTCGEDHRASDLGNVGNSFSPTVRFSVLTCIIPSLTASTATTVALTTTGGSPATGTDLTQTNIRSTSYDNIVTIVTKHGTTETVSPLSALNNSETIGWVDTSTASVIGKWRKGTGLVTGYISYVPFKSGGGTLDPDGLYAIFDTECYKGQTGAYNASTNPILKCTTDISIGNGVAQNVSPTDTWAGLTMTPTGCHPGSNWAKSQPAIALTVASNTIGYQTMVAASGTPFAPTNIVGTVIDDGTGFAVITHVLDSTHAIVNLAQPFAGTTIPSGGYTLYPIQMPYGSRVTFRCWYAPGGTASNVDPENGNIYLGNAWDGTGGPGIGPASWFISTRMLPNYNSLVNPGIGGISNLPAVATTSGTNPSGYDCFFNAAMTWNLYQQSTGAYNGRGAAPATHVEALMKPDADFASALFDSVERYMTLPIFTIDNRTGIVPDITNSPYYHYKYPSAPYTLIPTVQPANSINCWGAYPNTGHAPDPFVVPYLFTGDYKYMVADTQHTFGLTSGFFNSFANLGTALAWLAYPGEEERAKAWPLLNYGTTMVMHPDADTVATPYTTLGWFHKDTLESIMENFWTSDANGSANYDCANPPFYRTCSGTNIGLIGTSDGGTCPGGAVCNPNYSPNDFRALDPGGFGFEAGYGNNIMAWLHERGALSANGERFYKWYATGPITGINSTSLPDQIIVSQAYHWETFNNGIGVCPLTPTTLTWAGSFEQINQATDYAADGGADPCAGPAWGAGRLISGTISFTGTNTVGQTLHFTLPAGTWLANGGTAFYANGHVNSYDFGDCQITSVTSNHTLDCTVLQTFGHTSYTNVAWTTGGLSDDPSNQQLYIPLASPPDTNGLEIAGMRNQHLVADSSDIYNITRSGIIQAAEYQPGIPGASTALSTILGLAVPNSTIVDFNIVARP